jgi:hypothetical protein
VGPKSLPAVSLTSTPYLANQLLQANDSALSIPRPPTSALRLLNQRPNSISGNQRIATLMLHTLKSYPLMLIRDDTLPPFIHTSFVTPDLGNKNLESLHNCISLVHMIRSGIQGSRKLFWRNVRMECEHLCADVSGFVSLMDSIRANG